MNQLRTLTLAIGCLLLGSAITFGQTTISMELSGPGVTEDGKIKAGEPVSVDVYWDNKDDDRRGFTTGFEITSETIKKIVHVPDSGNGINDNGDIKAYNGFGGSDSWDFTGLRAVTVNWDGELPDVVGFGGLRVKQIYNAHPRRKVLSWTMIVPETGEITIDSTFFQPGGIWAIVGADGVEIKPEWDGPYTYEVVE